MIFEAEVSVMSESKNGALKMTLIIYFLISQILWVAITASIFDVFMPSIISTKLIIAAALVMTASWLVLCYLAILLWVMTWRSFMSNEEIRDFAESKLQARSPLSWLIKKCSVNNGR
jgi:ammonia channel protein AmtB